MSHLTDLQCSMFADEALPMDEAETISLHLETCADCQTRIAECAAEKNLLRNALNFEEAISIPAAPKFSKPLSLRTFALANVFTGMIVWLAQFLWKTLFGELIVNAFMTITDIYVPNAYELITTSAMYFYREGTTMIDTYLGFIILALLSLGLAWAVHSFRKARVAAGLCVLVVTGGSLFAPEAAVALELRHGDGTVTVDAGETIEDTIMMAGATVVVDGSVNGDLFAAGQRVVINGSVSGNLFAFGESVSINGEVGGMTLGAAQSFELSDVVLAGDFWGAGENVSIRGDSRIARNASIAAETVTVEGNIKRDLTVVGERIELSGAVGEDLDSFTEQVNLLGDASVGGNLRFRNPDKDMLQRSPGSSVGGQVEYLSMPEEFEPRNRYLTGDFYLSELFSLLAAFLTGLVLLWFFPDLRYLTVSGGADGLKTAGIGLVALVSLPILALLIAVTLVGLPLTVIGLFYWGLAIYLAKIVLASFIGQAMLASTAQAENLPVTLLAGLVVIAVAINIPGIGGIISFVLTIVGIGMVVKLTLEYAAELGNA